MKSLLAFFAAPTQSSNIVQAMAIQSHQPDVVVQIEADIQGQAKIERGRPFLEKWLKGSDALLDLFPDLHQPFEFPHTPPKGYTPGEGSKAPELVKIKMNDSDILEILKNIERDYPEHECIFDLLPGAKLLKIDVLLKDVNRWKQTYTLENGGFLEFGKEGVKTTEGHFLSIVDRSWLAGFPIHVSMTLEEIRSKQEFYSMVTDSTYIEKFTDGERQSMNSRLKSFTREDFKIRKRYRPISIRSDKFIERFHAKGGEVVNRRPDGIELKGLNGEEWDIEFFQNMVPNVVPLEFMMVNEISKGWNCDEVFQGVSIVQPSSELREMSFKNFLKKQHEDFLLQPKLEHMTGPFRRRCEALGLSADTPLEELISLEINRMGECDDDEKLAFIRVCEIDALTLDSHGVCSFDAKQIIRQFNIQQARMQRPAFLFNPKEAYYFVTGSTSHDKKRNNQYVIHISNLKKGRDVFRMKDKHEWNPSAEDLKDLKADWFRAVNEILKSPVWKWNGETSTFRDYFEEEVGISWELLSKFLFNKQIDPVDAMLQNYPIEEHQKDILIRVAIDEKKWIIHELNKDFHELNKNARLLKNKLKKKGEKKKESALVAQLRKKIVVLENKNKKKSKNMQQVEVIELPEIKQRLTQIVDKEVSYNEFNESLRKAGFRTKGIQAKIETISKEMGWKFNKMGKIMIRSTVE